MVIVVNGLHSEVNGQFATTQFATTESQIAKTELRGYP